MQYVDFGRTGLRVSRLGFGGIPVQRIDEPGTRAMLKVEDGCTNFCTCWKPRPRVLWGTLALPPT